MAAMALGRGRLASVAHCGTRSCGCGLGAALRYGGRSPAPAAPGAAALPAVTSSRRLSTVSQQPPPTTDRELLTADGGVVKTILATGSGSRPVVGMEVTAHYVGTLADGTVFDSSRQAGRTALTFKLGEGRVIKGWEVAIAAMQKGEKATITLQPEYAYGANGAPPKIGPNAVLDFELELLDFHPPAAAAAPIQVNVTVPEGAEPGQKLRVQVPDGRTVVVTVPPGAPPGAQLQVQVAPAPAPAPAAAAPAPSPAAAPAARPPPVHGELLSSPEGPSALIFTRAHGSLTSWENGDVERTFDNGPPWRAAVCSSEEAVMDGGGQHYAQFTVKHQMIAMHFGIVRPSYGVKNGKDPHNTAGCCFYDAIDGRRWWPDGDSDSESVADRSAKGGWEGQAGANVGDRIGFLLDLDVGSLTVYKNDERLGLMVREGLRGPLCWAASLYNQNDRVRIEQRTDRTAP